MRRPGDAANEGDWRVTVVHGCFPEGGDSTLSAFSRESLPAKLQLSSKTTNEFLWLAE